MYVPEQERSSVQRNGLAKGFVYPARKPQDDSRRQRHREKNGGKSRENPDRPQKQSLFEEKFKKNRRNIWRYEYFTYLCTRNRETTDVRKEA